MKRENELKRYDELKNWDFTMFEIETECLTNWDLAEILKKLSSKDSRILDLGTGGGEQVLRTFPECQEILGTDLSQEMINTANKNLLASERKNITFRVMDNLAMDVPEEYFDIVVARHTVTDPKQIMKCLKPGGYLLIRGVDKDDCWGLKMVFGKGQGFRDVKPISIADYENVVNAGFKDVELVPIHEREYFKNREIFKAFLMKVPIINDFSEENPDDDYCSHEIDDDLLDEYISENTYDGKIRLIRRYYGITARKK